MTKNVLKMGVLALTGITLMTGCSVSENYLDNSTLEYERVEPEDGIGYQHSESSIQAQYSNDSKEEDLSLLIPMAEVNSPEFEKELKVLTPAT